MTCGDGECNGVVLSEERVGFLEAEDVCGCAGSPRHHKGHGCLCVQRGKRREGVRVRVRKRVSIGVGV